MWHCLLSDDAINNDMSYHLLVSSKTHSPPGPNTTRPPPRRSFRQVQRGRGTEMPAARTSTSTPPANPDP